MTDRYLELAHRPWLAPLLRAAWLPRPPRLRRDPPVPGTAPLTGRTACLVAAEGGEPSPLAGALERAGARLVDASPADVLLVDLSTTRGMAVLDTLPARLQAAVRSLNANARVLLLLPSPARAPALSAGLTGFVRSLAKEIGRRGATANALVLVDGLSADLDAALAFFCTDRSAYVSGQVLTVGAGPTPLAGGGGGRTALVTGAAGGIGAATARRLASDGVRVLCVDVPAAGPALERLSAEVGGTAVAVDLTAMDGPAQVAAAAARAGGLHLLVHNAGITRDRTFARMSAEEWRSVLAVNLHAILAIDAAIDAAGLLHDGAREVCLASIGGIAGNAGQTNYAATKAAVIGHVQARARELAPRGIAVNAVAPGFIETAMTRRMPLLVREAGRRLNALRQGGLPEDVAEAIAFLGRPDAGGVTGQTLRVCGQSFVGA